MWCRNANNQLSALVDGELAPALELAVRSHVEKCPRCSDDLSRMRSLVQLTRGIPMEAVPAGIYSRTLTRLAYANVAPTAAVPVRRNSPISAFWIWPAFAGAAAAVVIAGLIQPPHHAGVDRSRRPAPSVQAAAPAPAVPANRAEAPLGRSEHLVPHSVVPAPQPLAEVPLVVTDPAAAAPSVVPAVTRVASVTRPSRSAARGVSGDGRPAASRGAAGAGVSPDMGEVRVQPDQPDRDSAPAPMMAEVPDAPADGDLDQPAPTEMAATMDRDASMRIAGFTPDSETATSEDEGAQMLRMYLAERNRTVPQPPAVGMGRRRHPKPL